MKLELSEDFFLDERVEVSLDELAELSGLSRVELLGLVETGVLIPVNPHEAHWRFAGNVVVTVRSVRRLRDDFELDTNALPLALVMLERIRELEAELREVQAKLPRLF